MEIEKIVTRQLTIADQNLFPAALELLNRTQGRDLFQSDYLHARTQDSNSYVAIALHSPENSNTEVVGAGVAQIISSFDYYIPFDPDIVKKLSGKIVGSFSTLCVHESLQGKGIGKRLSEMRMQWLKEKNCQVIVGISWVSGKAHTSDRVFEKMGFKAIGRLEDFYAESSLEKPFICPTCGEPPCNCSAVFYMRSL